MSHETLRSRIDSFIKSELESKPFLVSKADKQECIRRMQRTFTIVGNELSCDISQDLL